MLSTVSDLSSGALSFWVTLNQYMSHTEKYGSNAKKILRNELDPKEKSFISKNTDTLKKSTAAFNEKRLQFGEITRKLDVRIRSLTVYDELLSEMNIK